ncbi:MAG: hypothetical protein M1542_08525 [Thermotogae bacterium]|jgi:hypothetical protein|nr:hypothetical protein [Thermotogota bacterium]
MKFTLATVKETLNGTMGEPLNSAEKVHEFITQRNVDIALQYLKDHPSPKFFVVVIGVNSHLIPVFTKEVLTSDLMGAIKDTVPDLITSNSVGVIIIKVTEHTNFANEKDKKDTIKSMNILMKSLKIPIVDYISVDNTEFTSLVKAEGGI